MTERRPGRCRLCRQRADVNRYSECASCASEKAKWNQRLAKEGLKTIHGRQYIKGNGVKSRVARPKGSVR